MTSLLPPPNWGLYHKHGGQQGHFCRECLRGNNPGDSPALSGKVTTECLSAPISRWKARCHLLWINGSWPPVHFAFLCIDVEEPHGSPMEEKKQIIFQLDSGAHFSVLSFSPGLQCNDMVIIWGHIWQAPSVLFYQASGLLFGRPPFLSFFPHST
jgi:hypothetical protein